MSQMAKTLSVGIIGAGPGGLALGIFLQKAGFRDFTIFDREDGVGGTWRINTYPGLACDVKSHLYSYSFDLNANWSRLWSGQPEILELLRTLRAALSARPEPEAEHRDRLGTVGRRYRQVAADDRRPVSSTPSTSWCRRSASSPNRCFRTSSRRSRSPAR